MKVAEVVTRLSLLALLMVGIASGSQAQVTMSEESNILSLGIAGQPLPLIQFDLRQDWIQASGRHFVAKGKMGSIHLKPERAMAYHFERIDSMIWDDAKNLHLFGRLERQGLFAQFEIAAKAVDGDHLQLEISAHRGYEFMELKLSYLQPSNLHLYGFGEQFSQLNMQGHRVPLIPEENGIGRGDPKISGFTRLAGVAGNAYATYCPIPFYMRSDGIGIAVPEGSPWYFDFRQENRAEVLALDSHLRMDIWVKPSPLGLIEGFTHINGRFPLLPDWAFGTWLGMQGGAEIVGHNIEKMKAAGLPIAAIWIQDWVGKRDTKYGQRLQWHWEADLARYPDLKNWIANLRNQDIRVLGYINPFLKSESPWLDQMKLKRMLIEDGHGRAICLPVGGFEAYQFELHDPAVREYLAELIYRNMIEMGFSGWMADFAEWYPYAGSLHTKRALDSLRWIALHNDYPILWQQTNHMALAKTAHPEDYVFFSRSGYSGAGKYASIYWAGDQMTSWGANDGLPSALRAMLSSGMSGIAINHSDIGGYTNVDNALLHINRDAELLQRWAELAAFSPIFRTHEGLKPSKNVQPWDGESGQLGFIKMAKIHDVLKDYLKALNVEAHEKGWPMMRHLWLHYPHDPNVLDLDAQYLLGADMLVIPQLEAAAKRKDKGLCAYFPEGIWEHLLIPNATVQGPAWQQVTSDLGLPAVYIRSESPWKSSLQAGMAAALK